MGMTMVDPGAVDGEPLINAYPLRHHDFVSEGEQNGERLRSFKKPRSLNHGNNQRGNLISSGLDVPARQGSFYVWGM